MTDGSRRPRAPGWTLFVLVLVGTIAMIDRQIISLLVVPIRHELSLSNTEIGLVTGAAFALTYTTLGIPLAWASDRFSRVWILSACLGVWSVATSLCGVAQSFLQLFLARVGVGAGEAGNAPASLSLISDIYPPERRAGALGIYGWFAPLGTLFGIGCGGWLADQFGWRITFLLVGAPGLLLAASLPFAIKDPRSMRGHRTQVAGQGSIRTVLRALRDKHAFGHIAFGAALYAFVSVGKMPFIILFLHSTYGLSLTQIGVQLGVAFGLGGMLGSWLSGLLADRARQRSVAGYPLVVAGAFACAAPFYVAALFAPTAQLSILCFAIGTTLNGAYTGPTYAAIHGLVPPSARSVASSVLLFIASIVGLLAGSIFIGWLTDLLTSLSFASGSVSSYEAACGSAGVVSSDCVAAENSGRKWALMLGAVVLVWSAAHYALAARTITKDTIS